MFVSLKRFFFSAAPWAVLLAALLGFFVWSKDHNNTSLTQHTMLLILPDGHDASQADVAIWLDAAREEGIPLQAISDSDFMRRPDSSDHQSVAVLPDTFHRYISPVLVARLEQFTQRGGQLMVSYDAGILANADIPAGGLSPLSNLVGVQYGPDRERFGASGVERSPLFMTDAAERLLKLPPGKAVPFTEEDAVEYAEQVLQGPVKVLSGYQYGALLYPLLATSGEYAGDVWMVSESGGIAAGYRKVGDGGVLFVNTPVGYLKGQTDGVLLHALLTHLAFDLAGFPILKAAPDGVGSLIFNWHVDSNASIPEFKRLKEFGILEQGPYSIHFTAGPDVDLPGDRKGLDLEHNADARRWALIFRERGDALGNHGGWIHNYFGAKVSEQNRDEMVRYLEMNEQAVSAIAQAPSREYSAPQGNQPEWVTQWLEEHGVVGYYFTGNTGLAPTRSYRDGVLNARHIWSFPVLTLGRFASFEEFDEEDLSDEEVSDWLKSAASYAADNGVIRTIYSHPNGFHHFAKSLKALFAHTKALHGEGRFRWTTMSSTADFLNRREQTQWSISGRGDAWHMLATHPQDLANLTWEVPKSGDAKPQIVEGAGRIEDIGRAWRITASGGKQFEFIFQRKAVS